MDLESRGIVVRAAKTKALISFAVTAKLICAFVFAYADCWFSHEAALLVRQSPLTRIQWKQEIWKSGLQSHRHFHISCVGFILMKYGFLLCLGMRNDLLYVVGIWLKESAKVIKICPCTPIHTNLAANQKNANIENVIMDLAEEACKCHAVQGIDDRPRSCFD